MRTKFKGWQVMTRRMKEGRPHGPIIGYSRDGWFAYREKLVFCGRLEWRWALYQNRRTLDSLGNALVAQRLQAHYRTLNLAMWAAERPSAGWLGAGRKAD